MSSKKTGGCLCKAVQYEITVEDDKVHVCHCGICQKWHGGPALAVAHTADVKITGEDKLKWYQSSEYGQRGFCSECGSNLMFKAPAQGYYGVAAGTLDSQDGLEIETHIFIDKKPSYYDFADKTPRLSEKEFLEMVGAA